MIYLSIVLLLIPFVTEMLITHLFLIALENKRFILFLPSINKKIKILSKQKKPVYVNGMFREGLKIWDKKISKLQFIPYVLIIIFISCVPLGLFLGKEVFIKEDLLSNVIVLFIFSINLYLIFYISYFIVVPKLQFKKVYKLLDNWHFSKEKLFFDREYNYSDEEIYGDLKARVQQGFVPTSFKKLSKSFAKEKDISWFYTLIWGVHLPELKKTIQSPKYEYLYQEFTNLLNKPQ
ncbi:hypothetical protein [Mesomycoplasma molare]|uniref:Uncharacterized protein n=1 Tax=Mesomycoplasma molare TaxID=171288 RepID=A0ABY5TU84_9BACT|nr:hypothetical protein [Mesomycoplasma molare]UWD34232.1 hypothetical protein NX772_00150 [Mesomycoplasma molare]